MWSSTYHSCPCFLNTSALDPSFWQAIPERQCGTATASNYKAPVQRTPQYINEAATSWFLEIKGSKVPASFFFLFLSTRLSRTFQKNTDEGNRHLFPTKRGSIQTGTRGEVKNTGELQKATLKIRQIMRNSHTRLHIYRRELLILIQKKKKLLKTSSEISPAKKLTFGERERERKIVAYLNRSGIPVQTISAPRTPSPPLAAAAAAARIDPARSKLCAGKERNQEAGAPSR